MAVLRTGSFVAVLRTGCIVEVLCTTPYEQLCGISPYGFVAILRTTPYGLLCFAGEVRYGSFAVQGSSVRELCGGTLYGSSQKT